MMKGYRLAWVFVLFCLLMVVAGCTAVPTATAPAENVDVLTDQETEAGWAGVDPSGQSLTFWHQHRGDRAEAFDALQSRDSNATNRSTLHHDGGVAPGRLRPIFSKMLTLLGTSDVPSLVIAYQYQAASYQLADGLVDLNSLVNDPVWGLSAEEQADFFPGFYASDVFPTFDGARLGFPPNRSIEVMYYNIDWLAELGYSSPPTTPEAFLEMACRAVDEPFSGGVSDESSLGLQWGHSPSSLAALTFSFGGDIFDYETGQFTYDDPAAVAALEFIRSVYDAGCADDVVERGGHYAAFGRGKLPSRFQQDVGMPFAASRGSAAPIQLEECGSAASCRRPRDESLRSQYQHSQVHPGTGTGHLDFREVLHFARGASQVGAGQQLLPGAPECCSRPGRILRREPQLRNGLLPSALRQGGTVGARL